MVKYNGTQMVAYCSTGTGIIIGLWLLRRIMQAGKCRRQHIGAHQADPHRWLRNAHLELPVWPAVSLLKIALTATRVDVTSLIYCS